MTAVVVLEENVLRFICWYAPQSESSSEDKQSLCDELKCEWDMFSAGDLVMCLGNINRYVGGNSHGFDGVHGWYVVGQRNLEGRKLLQYSLKKE